MFTIKKSKSKSVYFAYKVFKNLFNINNFIMDINYKDEVIFKKYVKEISLKNLKSYLKQFPNVTSCYFSNKEIKDKRDIPLSSSLLEKEEITIFFRNKTRKKYFLHQLYCESWFILGINSYEKVINRIITFAEYNPKEKKINYNQSLINLAHYTKGENSDVHLIYNTNHRCQLQE